MDRYNYEEVIKDDIRDYIKCNIDLSKYYDRDKTYTDLYDDMFCSDSITGNGSGSYFCNALKADECLCHNWDLLNNAIIEFGYDDINVIEKGSEWCDVVIRCYLLGTCLNEILNELWEEFEEELE